MDPNQTVLQMVEDVLSRQARKLADRLAMPFEEAMATVAATEAGAQLKELGEGDHRHKEARHWQANLPLERSRRRAVELGWRSGSEIFDSSPSKPAPPRESQPRRASVREGRRGLTSEEALVGTRVRVSENHHSDRWRGEEGIIRARWGEPDYVALDVEMADGLLQLFWHHELRATGNGNGSANGNGSTS